MKNAICIKIKNKKKAKFENEYFLEPLELDSLSAIKTILFEGKGSFEKDGKYFILINAY